MKKKRIRDLKMILEKNILNVRYKYLPTLAHVTTVSCGILTL